jgi:hypothetical protein
MRLSGRFGLIATFNYVHKIVCQLPQIALDGQVGTSPSYFQKLHDKSLQRLSMDLRASDFMPLGIFRAYVGARNIISVAPKPAVSAGKQCDLPSLLILFRRRGLLALQCSPDCARTDWVPFQLLFPSHHCYSFPLYLLALYPLVVENVKMKVWFLPVEATGFHLLILGLERRPGFVTR